MAVPSTSLIPADSRTTANHNYMVAQIKITHRTKYNFSITVWDFYTMGDILLQVWSFLNYFSFLQSYGCINIPCHIFNFIHSVSKKYTPWCLSCLIITLANVDQFSKFFYQLIHRKIFCVYTAKISITPATMLLHYNCESWKSKNVVDFDSILNKLLTCSWGHFEHLI